MKLSEKARKVISMVAPTLGTALGGPLGGLAGKVLAEVVTGSPDADGAAVEEALLSQKPETLLALRAGEQQFLIRLEELGIEREKLDYQDRDSARQRETQVKDSTNKVLAYTVVGSFVALVGGVLLGAAQVESALAGTLVGYLSAKAEQVLAYYFGSTSTSKQKNELLLKAKAGDTQ